MRPGLGLLTLLLSARPAAAQDPRIEPVLIDLQIGRIVSRTVPAHRAGDDPLIPVGQFLEMAEIRVERLPGGRIAALFQPGNRRLEIRPAERRLVLAGTMRALGPGEFLTQDNELYLSARLLGELLGISWDVSWTDLQVTVIDPAELPVARRLRREALMASRRTASAGPGADAVLREKVWPVEGLVADYSALVPTEPGPGAGAWSGALGFNLLGGSLVAGAQNEGPARDGKVRLDLSWTGVWRENRWLSQVRLGDGFTTGPRTRTVRGFALGNVPFRRPDILTELPFSATLGPGWEVEAYRGGRLLSFDSVNALGQYSLDVPIQYGENPVDFIAYGPFGEVRQFSRTYRVSPDAIQPGRLEYGVSGGACRREAPCDATANLDVRYGLGPRVTLFAGFDRFWRDTLPHLFHPYAGVIAGLTNSVVVEAEVVRDAIVRGLARFEPSSYLLFQAEATRFDRDIAAPLLTQEGRRSQFTAFGQFRPFGGRLRHWFVFDAGFDRLESDDGRQLSARVGGSLQPGQVRFIPALRWERTEPVAGGSSTRTLYGLDVITLPLRDLGGFWGQVSGRAGVEFVRGLEAQSARAYLSRPIGRYVRLELGGSWFTGQRATLSAFLAVDLPQARAYTTVERAPAGDVRATQFVQGSMLYNAGSGQASLDAGPSVQLSGVAGRVFLDANDNGRHDEGEYALPNVQVTVGLYSKVTNERGEFRIWPLPAYDPVLAGIDTTTLASPLWVPSYSAIQVEPLPNRFTALDIPVVSGGVVEGRVVRNSPAGEVPVPGIEVVFRHVASGRERRFRTFTDGTFYALSIRPGEWDLAVDSDQAALVGGASDTRRIVVPHLVEGASITGLVLRIR